VLKAILSNFICFSSALH